MTTPLATKIKALIRANGPLSVTDYFAICLADPEYGYYKTRNPFGSDGDFVTAPEVSQLFGEMLGVFMVIAWRRHGEPPQERQGLRIRRCLVERIRLGGRGPGVFRMDRHGGHRDQGEEEACGERRRHGHLPAGIARHCLCFPRVGRIRLCRLRGAVTVRMR